MSKCLHSPRYTWVDLVACDTRSPCVGFGADDAVRESFVAEYKLWVVGFEQAKLGLGRVVGIASNIVTFSRVNVVGDELDVPETGIALSVT